MEEANSEEEFFTAFRAELKNVEKKVAEEIDPGLRGVVVGIAIMIAFLALLLPHAGDTRGVDILSHADSMKKNAIGLPSILFTWVYLVCDIGVSITALLTRKWVYAWIAAAGCSLSVVLGMLSIWLRQTPGVTLAEPPKPGAGLWIQLIIATFLAFHWIRIIGIRTNYHLAIEAERRAVAEQKSKLANIKNIIGE